MQANNWLIRHRFGVRVKFARPARETVCGWDEFAYEKWTNLTVIEMQRGNTLGTRASVSHKAIEGRKVVFVSNSLAQKNNILFTILTKICWGRYFKQLDDV